MIRSKGEYPTLKERSNVPMTGMVASYSFALIIPTQPTSTVICCVKRSIPQKVLILMGVKYATITIGVSIYVNITQVSARRLNIPFLNSGFGPMARVVSVLISQSSLPSDPI